METNTGHHAAMPNDETPFYFLRLRHLGVEKREVFDNGSEKRAMVGRC